MVLITDLPPELISLLPNHLSSLGDWYALIRTSRYFYTSCASTTARFPPVFQQEDGRPLLPANPHMLLSGIARQIGDWAVRSGANRRNLRDALERGNVGLLDLGAQVARLSVQDVRALHRDKIEIVKPLAERVYQEVRTQDVERNNPPMLGFRATTEVCVFNHVIYSELFHHGIDRILGRDRDQHRPLSPGVRHIWIEHCMSSPKARTSASVRQDGIQSTANPSSGEHSLGSPTDSEDVAEDTIDFRDLTWSETWNSIWAFRLSFPDIRYIAYAISALDHQGMDSLRLRLSLSNTRHYAHALSAVGHQGRGSLRVRLSISNGNTRHNAYALSALDYQGIDSLRLWRSLSNRDTQRLASDAEEVIHEAARFMNRLEKAWMELPRDCDLMDDFAIFVVGRDG